MISVFFVTLFLLAFRSPTPHDLHVGIAGPGPASAQLRQAVTARDPGALDLRDFPNRGAAQKAVTHRDVYAALAIERKDWTLLVAGANGSALGSALQERFAPAADAAGARLSVRDLVPPAPETSRDWPSSMPYSGWSWAASSSASTPTRSLPACAFDPA